MGRRGKLTVEAINQRLKAGLIGLSVLQRGNRLYLRGTFPPKPGSGKIRPHQQTLALGVYANPAGLEFAEARAKELGALIAQQRFSWVGIEGDRQERDTVRVWVEAFRLYALKNLISATGEEADLVWREQWWYPALKKLDQNAVLTEHAIVKAAQSTRANSRSRQVACQKLKRFAEFAGIEVDMKPYLGDYNPRDVKRDVPSDADIAAAIDIMPNPEWQWVAGMMACYGLRDHECWFARLYPEERDGRMVWLCRVEDGKTGGRDSIPPLPPQWVERWRLHEGRPPDLTVKNNKQYGDRTGRAFKRQGVGFSPYSLRHAYAIRAALRYGFPTAIAAKWLGHDPSVYLSTYQRHISGAQAMDAFFGKLD